MIENPRPEDEELKEEERLRDIFRLKKELNYTAIKDVRNLFRRGKETKAIKDRLVRYIKNLFKHEEKESFYKPVGVSNFWSNNYIEYKSNSHRNETLSVEDYFNKIRPYLKDIINNFKKSETWKTQCL